MQGSIIFVIVAAIMGSIAQGSERDGSSTRKLAEATQIETNRIYESGKPSELAKAFENVLHRPDAKAALVYIFEHAKTDAGRIYALTGLNRVDEREYRVRIGQINPMNKVRAMWYDVVRVFAVRELVTMIEAGELAKILGPET